MKITGSPSKAAAALSKNALAKIYTERKLADLAFPDAKTVKYLYLCKQLLKNENEQWLPVKPNKWLITLLNSHLPYFYPDRSFKNTTEMTLEGSFPVPPELKQQFEELFKQQPYDIEKINAVVKEALKHSDHN